MKAHRFWLMLGALLLTFSYQSLSSPAQKPDAKTKFEVEYAVSEADRRAIVASNLALTSEESDTFWPVYDDYRGRIKAIENERHELILKIAKYYKNLPSDEGIEMIDTALELHKSVESITAEHFEELKAVMNGKKLFRYFQINARLNAMFMHQLTRQIPIVPSESKAIREQNKKGAKAKVKKYEST